MESGTTFTTPSISNTTTYYIHCFNDTQGCRSESAVVEATVFPIAGISGVTVRCTNPGFWEITGTRTSNATVSVVESMSGVVVTYPSLTTFVISNVWMLYASINVTAVYPSLPCPSTNTNIQRPATCDCETPSTTPQTVCGTQSVSLIASGCPTGTYNWYADEYTNTILHTDDTYTSAVSGDITYFVSCTTPSNCISNRIPATVYFNGIPVGGSAGPDVEVCQVVGGSTSIGGVITLNGHSGTITGWQLATGNGPWGTNNNNVNGVHNTHICCFNPGIYYVRAVLNNNNGCGEITSTPAKITVYGVTHTTANSNSPICTGSNVLLSGFAPNATGYTWAGSSGTFDNANVANPSISGLAIGTHTFTVTSFSNGGCTNRAITTVVVQECTCTPLSDVEASVFPRSINLTELATLDVEGTGINTATVFNWVASPGSPAFNTSIKNPQLSNFTTAGGYSYTVTITNSDGTGICTATATTSLTVSSSCVLPAFSGEAIPATCNGNTANSDGILKINNVSNGDKVGYSVGATYTGAAYSTASTLPANGILVSNLANPATATEYTIRVFNGKDGCFKDTTVTLNHKVCVCPPVECLDITSIRIR